VIEEAHPALGTMTCRVAGTDLMLESPIAQKAAGEGASLAVRAGDILVATLRPSGISARNILSGKVEAIEDRAGMVELRVLCGATSFQVHITRGALQNLELQRGQLVWLIIKTHSIQFLRS
jgi:molybdate transport system ATP-binding protein